MRYVTTGSLWMVTLALAFGGAVAARQQQPTLSPDALMGQALHQEEAEGNLKAAIATYTKVIADPKASRALVASALLHVGLSQEKLGQREARAAYERIAREYADQAQVAAQARSRLAVLTSGDAPDTRVVARQVWAGDDVDPFGSPSSDGRLFAFAEPTSTITNIAVRNLVTGETRRLTHARSAADGWGLFPVLSPDGKQVAYVWEQGEGGTAIRLAAVDGSGFRVLREPGPFAHDLRWSPNGQQIAAVLGAEIVLISTADGAITQLKSMGWNEPELGGYSPDGRFLVYATGYSPSAPDHGIYALAVDGSREARLVQSQAKDLSPVWTPDGRSVVFVSNRSGTQDLWSVRVSDGKAEGEPELLRANIGDITNMGFTRDGSYFYGTTNRKTDVYVSEVDPDTLEVSSAPRRVSDTLVGSNSGPTWSPDGRFIAFFRGPDRRARSLVVRTIADGTERTLSTRLSDSIVAAGDGAVWMPDGRALLVPDNDYGHDLSRIRKVDVETGTDQVLLEGRGMWPVARVSPDGKALYYTKMEKSDKPDMSVLHLRARQLAGGEETELYRAESNGAFFFGLAVSPDGGRIAFMANEGTEEGKERTLMTVPTSGGPRRVLYRGTYNSPSPFGAAWTRDGRYILAFGAAEPRGMRLLAFPAEGGEPRALSLTMQGMSAIWVSPDGRRLAFTGEESKGEVWTIKNLLSAAAAPPIRTSR